MLVRIGKGPSALMIWKVFQIIIILGSAPMAFIWLQ